MWATCSASREWGWRFSSGVRPAEAIHHWTTEQNEYNVLRGQGPVRQRGTRARTAAAPRASRARSGSIRIRRTVRCSHGTPPARQVGTTTTTPFSSTTPTMWRPGTCGTPASMHSHQHLARGRLRLGRFHDAQGIRLDGGRRCQYTGLHESIIPRCAHDVSFRQTAPRFLLHFGVRSASIHTTLGP